MVQPISSRAVRRKGVPKASVTLTALPSAKLCPAVISMEWGLGKRSYGPALAVRGSSAAASSTPFKKCCFMIQMFLLDCLKKSELANIWIKTRKNSLFGVKPIGYVFAHNAQV